jgi:hypothetical protein
MIVGDISAFAMRIAFSHKAIPLAISKETTRFLVTLVLGVIGLAGQQPQKSKPQTVRGHVLALASGGTLHYSTQHNRTLVEIRPAKGAGEKTQVRLSRDETVAPGSRVLAFELLAEKPPDVYLVTDRYASLPGPMSYCQAGQEQFVRVLVRAPGLKGGLHETFSSKVESCRSNLELGPAGLSWDSASSTLTVDGDQLKRYRISENGLVTPY